jgi:hypothetical protein
MSMIGNGGSSSDCSGEPPELVPEAGVAWRKFERRNRKGQRLASYSQRPYCDLCGPFRGDELRKVGRDEFGTLWRCRRCDEEEA